MALASPRVETTLLMNRTYQVEFAMGLELTTHLKSLKCRALQLCGSAVEAEDLLQDTFERALRFQRGYEPGTNLRAWLNRILMTVFISKKRRSTRERNALARLNADPCAWVRPEPSPEVTSVSPRVKCAVDCLPRKFRDVVWLVDVGDMSYKDAAEQLSVPVGTVMSRLHRGRRQLAATLSANESSVVEPARAA
jgi:RNA polymerase sigma-70 factor (ECF subfamily)